MLFELVLIQKFTKQFVVAIMERNAMIVSQARRVDLLMEFGVMLGFVELVPESFHRIHLRHYFNISNFEKQRAAYIPIRGFTPQMIN